MAESVFDLTRPRRLHVVGVGGTGMNAVASVLVGMGHQVSGSDVKGSAAVDRVAAQGVRVWLGHDPEKVGEVDALVISTAVPASNPEVRSARERGVPVLHRSELLAAIAAISRTVAVAGTHGKTTTSSMLALALREAGMQPSFVIGGDVNEIGTGAGWGDGDVFVVEADESDGSFLRLNTGCVLVTNVEPDHLEHYGGWDGLHDAFAQFVREAPGPRVVCIDDPGGAELAASTGAITYGTAAAADYRIEDLVTGRASTGFRVVHDGEELTRVELPLPGLHNARNATGALVAALVLGAPLVPVVAALGRFAGVARRFEFRGTSQGITFVDDYAHLPTEVAAAVDAALGGGWSRLVVVFQPHRYSRTATLGASFRDAFVGVDHLVLTDVYASGEAPRPGVSGELVLHAVLDAHPRQRTTYLPRRTELARYLAGILRPGDLCLSLGAGDITALADEVRELLDEAAVKVAS